MGVILLLQVIQLFAQQDPCPRQIHEDSPFFLAFLTLRHPQAFHCITLEIDQAAHLPHSIRPARVIRPSRLQSATRGKTPVGTVKSGSVDSPLLLILMLRSSSGKFVIVAGHDWGTEGGGAPSSPGRYRCATWAAVGC